MLTEIPKVENLMRRLGRAFGGPDREPDGFDGRRARSATRTLEKAGLMAVTYASSDAELEQFVQRLEDDQNWLVWERMREWLLNIHYIAGEQRIAWHRGRRTYVQRPLLPWSIKSFYNVCAKAENIRVSRLTENKPTVAVQARTASRDDIEKAEYKEQLFWCLWDKLRLHEKIVRARRWAYKTGSGILKCGWDPEHGPGVPATRQVPRRREIPVLDEMNQPVVGPDGQPQTESVIDGVDEFYLDKRGEVVGPVEIDDEDPVTGQKIRVKAPIPPDTEFLHEGEAFVEVLPTFEVRWDRFTDDLADSWYVQHIRVRPMRDILADFPDKAELLRAAELTEDSDSYLRWTGLVAPTTGTEVPGVARPLVRTGTAGESTDDWINREYRQVETWIYPKNDLLRKLWGERGAVLTTVGGKLIDKKPMPAWAARAPNFIQLPEILEEGNHYGKPPMRDLVPLQDDINRTRSMQAERNWIAARLLLWAPNSHGMNFNVLGGLPGALLTTRSKDHKPDVLDLGQQDPGLGDFYNSSLSAFNDLANANDASSGKLPSAGIAAKAIYALQYADERSITETSNLQDLALKRLAEALDAITRTEYTEARKIRIVGPDRSFLVEHELGPDTLQVDVDYSFTPGSMLSRQKDAVKNEMLALLDKGLITHADVRKHLPTVTPDMFRLSYDLQEAAARRLLSTLKRASEPAVPTPQPWQDPSIFQGVFEEYLLSDECERFATEAQRRVIAQAWQTYQQMAMRQAIGQAQPGPAGAGVAAGAADPGGVDPGSGAPIGSPGEGAEGGAPTAAAGAAQLEGAAVGAMEAPEPQ